MPNDPARFSPCSFLIGFRAARRSRWCSGRRFRPDQSNPKILTVAVGFITEDLVLDLRPCEAPFASRSIRRSCLSSCLYGSDRVERRVGAIVPAKDDL